MVPAEVFAKGPDGVKMAQELIHVSAVASSYSTYWCELGIFILYA